MSLNIEGTPVAIAAMAVSGIVGVCYSSVEPQAQMMAIQALGQLAGAAGGVAIPHMVGRAKRETAALSLADSPARFSPEFGEGG